MRMFQGRRRWQNPEDPWIKRHSLSVVIAALLAVQTAYAVVSATYVWNREQPLGEGLRAFGRDFWIWWSWEYDISIVADTYGVLLIVVLSKWLYEEGSSENGSEQP